MPPLVLPTYARSYQRLLSTFNCTLLFGLAATLLFDQNRYKALNYFIELTTLTLLISCYFDKANRAIQKQVAFGASIITLLLFNQLLSQEMAWPKSEIKDIVFMFCTVAAVALLPAPMNNKESLFCGYITLLLMLIATGTYLYYIYFMARPYGIFYNPHFLALSLIVLANFAMLFILKYTGTKRYIGAIILVASIFTLTLILSRIAWVAIGVSFLTWTSLYFQHHKATKIIALATILLGLFATTQVSYYSSDSINALSTEKCSQILKLWKDERVILWADTMTMQGDSDLKGWLVGHGLGAFESEFIHYSSYGEDGKSLAKVDFVFPHNFILEVLYNSGIIGLLALGTPLIYIVSRTFKNTRNKNFNAIFAVALLAGVFIHTFFTLPLFTRFPSTLLGLITGYCLWLNRDMEQHAK